MSYERQFSPLFSIDVTADAAAQAQSQAIDANELIVNLLHQVVEGQKREIALLEELTHHLCGPHKRREAELARWKESHPELTQVCFTATESLAKVQHQFLETMTQEVMDGGESMAESEYMLSEFVDRFGPRLAHLNGVLQVLSQLATPPAKDAPAKLVD
jgi:predicted HicB family RNase H-like nuclease